MGTWNVRGTCYEGGLKDLEAEIKKIQNRPTGITRNKAKRYFYIRNGKLHIL